MKHLLLFCSFLLTGSMVFGQETFPVNGPHNKNLITYAFTNATIYKDYKTKLENATLLVKEGKVVKAGTAIIVPDGAVVIDCKDKFIYPGFIDIYSSYGMGAAPKAKWERRPQLESKKIGAYHWNQAMKPELDAANSFKVNDKQAANLRKLGFGAVVSHHQDGITRGTSVFTSLANDRENNTILLERAAAQHSFSKGSSRQNYPSSQMGTIALFRQTYLDAEWYKNADGERNLSLEAFINLQRLPQIFDAPDYLSILRADRMGDEFGVQYIIKGDGAEYKRIEDIKATNASLIVPVNFPKAYDVEDVYSTSWVSLEQMKHWELAPSNLSILEQNSIDFALTTAGLKDPKVFWTNVKQAVERGLSEEAALAALTVNPADMIDMGEQIGGLYSGMVANFLVASGNIFEDKTIIHQNWIQGEKYALAPMDELDITGAYNLKVNGVTYQLEVSGKPGKATAVIVENDTTKNKVALKQDRTLVSMTFKPSKDSKSMIRLSGYVSEKELRWQGSGAFTNGEEFTWTAMRTGAVPEKKKDDKKPAGAAVADSSETATNSADSSENKEPEVLGVRYFPNMEYGFKELPLAETVVFRNATVWTNEKMGILKQADVLVKDGKIVSVGKKLKVSGAKEIDATGKHLTSGVIDEHSHIAISRGVNESGQAISAEVRIGDVVNSDDINIYRQLSGGVTAAQLLHGSANPVGGQSALIKMRWGLSPEEMKIKEADGFIKFALGENVKQSNWGDANRIRFPQTRMGVEQVYYDGFIRAKEYEQQWAAYKAGGKKAAAPRRDLELETLAEILNKKRFISCHSYQQGEINMLMHVADSMGFRVNTFTHILEGYKVADKMKAHGVGGSTFSDWWAYKFEVNDAIPYNAALMHNAGVVVAINSDDAEMGRRLNQEAGKGVKYGGMSQEDAWKMVSLNPAKLLHLDHRMGSIKPGKDADLVLWSANPLSINAKAEMTFVDGIRYYDMERDMKLREEIKAERARLIEKMINAKKKGSKTQKAVGKKQRLYHCDSLEEEHTHE